MQKTANATSWYLVITENSVIISVIAEPLTNLPSKRSKFVWFKHIYFVLQLYKHTNICDDNTSYGIRTEAKSL